MNTMVFFVIFEYLVLQHEDECLGVIQAREVPEASRAVYSA